MPDNEIPRARIYVFNDKRMDHTAKENPQTHHNPVGDSHQKAANRAVVTSREFISHERRIHTEEAVRYYGRDNGSGPKVNGFHLLRL